MRRHQKTETCKKFQVPVLSDFDKEVMRLCEEKEKEVNSDYEYDSDKSSESEWGWLGYDMLDNDEMTQLKDVLRKELQVVPEEKLICPYCKRDEDECEKNAEGEKNPITYWLGGWGMSCDDCHPPDDEDEDE